MRHVGAQKLARFRQGDLGPRRSSRIGAHLAACPRCRELDEDLAGVTTLLASVQPPPIPEQLEARIQSALTAEAARRVVRPGQDAAAAAPAPAGTGPADNGRHPQREPAGTGPADNGRHPQREPTGTGPAADGRHSRREPTGHGRPRRSPRPRPAVALRALAAAAVVVLVAGGVYEIARSQSSSSSSSPSSAAGPAVPAASAPAVGPALPYRQGGGEGSVTPVMTGTDFTSAGLSDQVTKQLTRYGRGGALAGPMAPSATHAPEAAEGGRSATFGHMAVSDLAGCVNRIAAGDLVLLVDVARYQGAPATVIVTRGAAGGPERIWVVGPGCSASQSDVLEHTALGSTG
jgi:hypothetical protein